MAVSELTAAPERRVSAGVDNPAPAVHPLIGSSEWAAAFIRVELESAHGPLELQLAVARLHRLIDRTAASLKQGVPA